MTRKSKRWCLFYRSHEAASALEYVIVVGVVLAGIAGVLVTFVDATHSPIGDVGSKVSTVTTPAFDLNE